MATVAGNLWEWNLTRVVVVDVTEDYRMMLTPMPGEFYPILEELWLPMHNLEGFLQQDHLIDGYLYDWHESPAHLNGNWYVGVVKQDLTTDAHFLAQIHRRH